MQRHVCAGLQGTLEGVFQVFDDSFTSTILTQLYIILMNTEIKVKQKLNNCNCSDTIRLQLLLYKKMKQ